MTLKQLEVFVAVANTRSFSRGAETACITQSTASQHIQSLEDELGLKLFDRGKGGALLTEGGKLFFGRAHKILVDCEEAQASVRRFRGMEDVVLRIGASNIPGACFIPSIMQKYLADCPGVRLEVLQGDSRSILDKLMTEEVELAFVGGRYGGEDRLQYDPIGSDSIILAASASLIVTGKAALSQSGLCKVPLLFREQGSGTQQAVDDALARTWIRRESLRVLAVFGSNEAIKRALLDGIGYAFVSSMSVADELASGRLVMVRVPGLQIRRNFYAVRRDARELSPAAAAFLKIMGEQGRG